jgi:hypothetical protein
MPMKSKVLQKLLGQLIFLCMFSGALAAQSGTDCSKCDCHFPVSDPSCVKCCFYEKGTVTATSEGTITLTPSAASPAGATRTFKVPSNTTIKGRLKVGESATVYYHKVEGRNIATRIEISNYVEGQLTPDSLPDRPDSCEGYDAGSTRVFLGNVELYSSLPEFVPLQMGDEDLITLQETKNGLLVSAKVFDSSGQLVAQLIDNEFFVNKNGAFRLEPSAHSLRIFGPDGKKIFDIEYANPNTVEITGTLFGPNGGRVSISENLVQVGGTHFEGCNGGSSRVGIHIGP